MYNVVEIESYSVEFPLWTVFFFGPLFLPGEAAVRQRLRLESQVSSVLSSNMEKCYGVRGSRNVP